MADQIPYSIAETLLTKLGSAVFKEIGLMYGVQDQLGKLNDTLSTVRDVLLDAEEKQQEQGHAIAGWIRRLKDVVYDADDLLDDFLTEDLRRRPDDRSRFGRQVSDFFSSSNHLVFRSRMGHRMKAIMERLDDIKSDIDKFGLLVKQASDVRVRNRGRETCSVVGRSHKIVGRDENKEEVIKLLMQINSQENLSMVVITGIGGLGKTTLAQLAYNDQRVADYFHSRMWVCVSDDFNIKTLIRNIIKSSTTDQVPNLELAQLEELKNHLKQNLDEKRYLLVLDDVWSEDKNTWDQFKNLLPAGSNESKILVTTRSRTVALAAGIDSPYVVEGLKEDESWDLFQSLAFRNGEEKTCPNLVTIGKNIVKRCSGVPLVIATLGSMLGHKTRESNWLSIRDNKNLLLLQKENNILPVLRLSYDNLPSHLKQCFAYCALFPKDYKIEKKLLVQLWMAQGYLQGSEDGMDLEDIGNDYFDDLLARSLFVEEAEKDYLNNDRLSYKMHDLIHDLAQSVVKSEVLILTDDMETIPETIHHISFFKKSNIRRINDLKVKSIRTLFMDCEIIDDHTKLSLSNLKYARVLKMSFRPQQIPTNWTKLIHLRFLDLSNGQFEKLPDAITRLKHLQTLTLLSCEEFKEWPKDMKKLINLRHLEIDKFCRELSYMPRGLGELTKLKTLPIYRVGKDRRHMKMGGGLSELKSLNNLRGHLSIEWDSAGTNESEGILAGKQHLERLRLRGLEKQGNEEEVSIMESLKPHPNLKELSIFIYGGERFPDWMMNDGLHLLLPNLVKIEMKNCKRIQVLPPFGQLPSLKTLVLERFDAVEYMEDYPSSSASFFPSLKSLNLWNLLKLEGWSGRRDVEMDVEDLQLEITRAELCRHLISISSSSLKHLSIKRIEDLTSLPEGLRHASALQTLDIWWCPALTTIPPWIDDLTSLVELVIIKCQQLISLPQEMQFPRHLHTLTIQDCPNLTLICQNEMGEDRPLVSHIAGNNIEDLYLKCIRAKLCMHLISISSSSSSLKRLHIKHIADLISLPEGLRHASALQTLEIWFCHALTTLPPWIGNLTSLTKLEIVECHQLTSLPQEMRSLHHLHTLIIQYCPNLASRCVRESGEDWPLISHIPHINIQDFMGVRIS